MLIRVVANSESVHGQSAEESRKAAFALFKKLKVGHQDCLRPLVSKTIVMRIAQITVNKIADWIRHVTNDKQKKKIRWGVLCDELEENLD